jgi:hypothetical protein
MRFPVPLVIELDDDQLTRYADAVDLPRADGQVRAKDAVDQVRAQVLAAVRRDFTTLGIHDADITIKR